MAAAVGLAVAGLVLLPGAGVAAASAAASPVVAPLPVPPPNPADPPLASLPRPVVLLGTAGLRWSDVSTSTTPAMAALGETWAVGNVAVRSIRPTTCPADGWLAVSAGTRAADVLHDDGCRELTGPVEGKVVGWDDYLQAAAADQYDAVPGWLGDTLADAGVQVAGIGPGAAVALARTDGSGPEHWSPRPDEPAELTREVSHALDGGARLVVVDLGTVHDATSATAVDTELQAALLGASDADVLVVSLADRGDESSFQAAAWGRPRASSPGLLTSASTRQTGMLLGTDVTATLLDRLGLGDVERPSWVIGAPIRTRAPGEGVAGLVDAARHASVVRPLVSQFYLGVVVVNIVLFAAVWFGLARPPGRRADEAQRRRVLRWLQRTGLAVAAIPVSLLVANKVPWWRAASPGAALAAVAAVVVVGLVALALTGPWRRSVLGPAGLVAGVTVGVVVTDVLNGSTLPVDAVFGSPTLLAGRFYGFNNTSFALAAVGALVVVGALVAPLVRAGRRWWAAGVAAVAGVALVVVDGSGGLGADFGGPPALLPGFTVLVLLLAGVRLTWRRVAVVVGAAAAVTMVFALVDWARPADQRTHLGTFVQSLVDGGAWSVVGRKLSGNLRVVGNNLPLTLLAIAGCAFVVAASVRPIRRMLLSPDGERYAWLSRGTALNRLGTAAPTLVPSLVATGTALVIGMLVNDSGIAIPAIGVAVVVPLVIAACAGWMTGLDPADPHEVVQERAPGRVGVAAARVAAGFGAARRWVRPPLVVGGLAAVALVGVLVPALRPQPAPPPLAASPRPVVLVGVTGLRWEDVGAFATPSLWALSRDHAVGQVAVRSIYSRACPVDGWLAVSSGARLAAARQDGRCTTVPDPVPDPASLETDSGQMSFAVAAWPDYRKAADSQAYSAVPGLLGDQVRQHHVTATAVGPGAAIAVADSDGIVAGTYYQRPEKTAEIASVVTGALTSSSLVVVDAGTIRDPGYETVDPVPDAVTTTVDGTDPSLPLPVTEPVLTQPDRAEQVKTVDERIGAVLAAADGTGATVMVVSLADSGRTSLRLAAVSGMLPGTDQPAVGLLTAASTRQPGLVQTTDVLPTLLRGIGVTDQALAGSPFTTTGPVAVADRMAKIRDMSRQSSQIGKVSDVFTGRLMLFLVLLLAIGTAVLVGVQVLVRRDLLSHASFDRDRLVQGVLAALHVGAVAVGAMPVASFLVNLTGWWRSPTPQSTYWSAFTGILVAIVAVAFVGPWRRSRVGPMAVLAVLTFVTLFADVVVLGSRLVIDSPLGTSRVVAGRFYGMNNQGFALFTVSGLIVAALLARALRSSGPTSGTRSGRAAALLAVLGVGAVVVIVDGAPGLGADFGGPPAQVTAFALLAVAVAGWRVRWPVALAVLGGAAAVTAGLALADYLRPPDSRTHLGRFVATVVAGGGESVVGRKIAANMRMLSQVKYTGPTLLSAVLTLWLCSSRDWFAWLSALRGRLSGLVRDEPLLAPTAACVAIALGIGFAVNDSGAAIPAVGLVLAVPTLLALAAAWLGEQHVGGQPAAPALDETLVTSA